MKTEHERLDEIAAEHERQARSLDEIKAGRFFTIGDETEARRSTAAHRRAAAIIRHQIECEA